MPNLTPREEEIVSKKNSLRNRPYDGQPHTDHGERGKTLIAGLTMRDVADCFNRACALSQGHTNPDEYERANNGELVDLYKLNWQDFDPGAIGQNLTCEIERMMGIFPNVPKIETTDAKE